MPIETVEDILNDLKAGRNPEGSPSKLTSQIKTQYQPLRNENFDNQGNQVVRPFEYKINPLAVMDRMSDGTYVSKYENYLGEVGNEDRLAQGQTTGEQYWNGLKKNFKKAGNYAIDATVGTATGLVSAIGSGDFRDFWDNDVSNSLDDWNKKLDYRLPNYYSDEQKSMGVFESMGTANFWANDVAGGLAFVGGALLPELAIGLLTGGASLPTSLAKIGFKASLKGSVKGLIKGGIDDVAKIASKNLDVFTKAEVNIGAKELVNAAKRANFGAGVGKFLNTSRFLVQSSAFEASMETRQNFHEATDSFYTNFAEKNGRNPTYEESQDFIKSAVNGANGVFVANMAILGVSNAVMFGKTFDLFPTLGKNITNFGNKVIGLGVSEKAGVLAMQTASRSQKIAGNTFKILGKPAIEGLYEEGLQGVAGKTMQKYLESRYNPKLEGAYSLSAALGESLSEQYGTKEGWKEMTIGMLIGFAGGKLQRGGSFSGLGNDSYSKQQKSIQKNIELANQSRKTLSTRIMDASTMANFSEQMGNENGDTSINNVEATMATTQYIQNQESIRSHKQISADYKSVVENMELTDEQISQIGEKNVGQYKAELINHFNETLTNYKIASKAVESLGLNGSIETTKGNTAEIGQYMAMSFMAGKGALQSAKNIGTQLDTLIGNTGTFSAIDHYNGLSLEQKQKIEESKKNKRRINNLEKSTRLLATQIAGVQTSGRQFSEGKRKERYNRLSSQYTALLEEKEKLIQEKETLDKALEDHFEVDTSNIEGGFEIDEKTTSVNDILEKLEGVDTYISSLRTAGKNKEANIVENLVEQAKEFSDSHREANNAFRSMLDTDFFKKKSSLVRRVLGSKYKMSDDFKKIIRDNSEIIDRATGLLGERGQERISQKLDTLMEENTKISDREKYRLESLIRLQLGYERLKLKVSETIEETEVIETGQEEIADITIKDTIVAKKQIDIANRDFSNLEVINNTIDELSAEITLLQEIGIKNTKTKEIRKNIEKNKKKDTELESTPGDFSLVDQLVNKITTQTEDTEYSPEEQQLQINYPKLIEKQLEDKKLNEDLATESFNGIIGREDYQRYSDLLLKKQKEGLDEEETSEIEALEAIIDSWTQLSGTFIDGIRMTDLLEQKMILENERPSSQPNYDETPLQEIVDASEFTTTSSNNNYAATQNYDAVTSTKRKDGKIEISGVSYESFSKTVGFDFEYEKDSRGNIVIEDNETDNNSIRNRINNSGNVTILPTNPDLTTTYSIVLVPKISLKEGETALKPMDSTHKKDIRKVLDSENIYNLKEGEDLFLEVDPNDDWNKEKLEEYKTSEDKEEIKKTILIRVITKEGVLVGILKGKRNGAIKGPNDLKFEAMRDAVVEDKNFEDKFLKGESKVSLKFKNTDIKVKKVLLGHPNFNHRLVSNGVLAVEYVRIDDINKAKISDYGYEENGKIKTNSQTGDVDTTFIKKQIDRKEGKKIPFVVINIGGKRVAYPVKLDVKSKPKSEDFQKIFDANIDDVTKSKNLNKFLAESGIDIQLTGNSFVAIGNKNNLKEDFFKEKLAQVQNINYFSEIENWGKKETTVEDILSTGLSINIDLSKPLHSPKMILDYGQVDLKTAKANPKKKTTKSKEIGDGSKAFLNKIKENEGVPESTELLNKKC